MLYRKARVAVLLAAVLAVAPGLAAQQEDIPSRPRSEVVTPELSAQLGPTGTIVVRLALASGVQIPFQAEVRLFSHMGFQQSSDLIKNDPQVVFRNVPVGEYNVEVRAPGFATARDQAILWRPGTVAHVFVNLRPEPTPVLPGQSGYPLLAPKVRKATEKGLQALREEKLEEARKQFERALKMVPGHPYVNFLVGIVFLRTNQFSEAQKYLEKATKVGPEFSAAHEALGVALSAQEKFAEAIPPLERALALNPDRWELHWRVGMAYFQSDQMEKALAYAERAQDLSKGASPETLVLLGFARARLGQFDSALKDLQAFLAAHPDRPESPRVRQAVQKLQEDTANAALQRTASLLVLAPRASRSGLMLEVERAKRNWAPPDVDESVPAVRSDAVCPLPEVLQSASQRVLRLAENLQTIGATERVDHAELDPSGYERSSGSVEFEYLVTIREPRRGHLSVEESRQGRTRNAPTRMFTGLAAMAMAFHPYYIEDFEMKCEGLGQWRGEPAWQIHFQQRKDRPSRIVLYSSDNGSLPISQKGRVWIGANSYHILRMETDLVRPVPEIEMARQHLAIEYAPVVFRERETELWLPSTAVVHMQLRGKRMRHQHLFRDFVLFSVDTRQKIKDPDPPPQD